MARLKSDNVQINISIPSEWKKELENLARIYSVEEGETITFLDLMLMCGKVTHKNLIDNRPLFRYYSSIWIEKTALIQYNKVSGRYLYEGKNTNH